MKRNWRWLLLLTAIIGTIENTDAIKASLLVLGRGLNTTLATTTTTATTSAPTALSKASESSDNDAVNEPSEVDAETGETITKPPLTGIPQIDYVWDPNLPRELNGYNLSSYPFLNSVPNNEDIDFKCDGLHDGFYASIKYSCQLYHHCVYGIRHDFLCANFTAFDQKSFICHFVSEVNCKNSAKYWFRNDALYKATTTTTTTTSTQAPPPTTSALPEIPLRRPGGRRPLRRRRPQQDYYYDDEEYEDDYLEERINRRRKPNRPRPVRPEYDDDYEHPRGYKEDSTEDDLYEHRPMHRGRIRDSDDEDYEYERRQYERPRNRNRPGAKRRHNDDDRKYADMDRRPPSEGRQFAAEADKRKPIDRRPLNSEDRRRPIDDRRTTSADSRRPLTDRRRVNSDRRPLYDDETEPPRRQTDYKDDIEDDRSHKRVVPEEKIEIVPKVRSSSSGSSIFNRSRAPPKISRPVPVNEKSKFQYVAKNVPKSAETTAEEELYDDEYDYESEPAKGQPAHTVEKGETKKVLPASSQIDRRPLQKDDSQASIPKHEDSKEYDEDEFVITKAPMKDQKNIYQRPQIEETRPRNSAIKSSHVNVKQTPTGRGSTREASQEDEEEDGILYDDNLPDPKEKAITGPVQIPRGPNNRLQTTSESSNHGQKPGASSYHSQGQNKFYRPASERDSSRATGPGGVSNQEQRVIDDADDQYAIVTEEPVPVNIRPSGFKMNANNKDKSVASDEEEVEENYKEYRPYVRVLKRPFLPSRGGNPYLPRGLKPLGGTNTDPTENSPIDIGTTTISGSRLLEHSQPIVRPNYYHNDYPQIQTGPRTTHQPQIDPPRSTLDEIFNEEYDVTLNDALNPTLKPITQSRGSPIGFSLSKYDRINPYARSDVSHSPTLMRSTALHAPLSVHSRPQRGYQPSPQQHYYDDELDY